MQWNHPVGGPTASMSRGSSTGRLEGSPPPIRHRLHVCTAADTLRAVVERLSVPGVRRLVVVSPETRRPEGIISLSDVATYLLL
jgi:5'-AMP-activated protein kinase regulatory gamma subunit